MRKAELEELDTKQAKMEKSERIKVKRKVSQVISCRIPIYVYEKYERKCLEDRVTMTSIIRKAVIKYSN